MVTASAVTYDSPARHLPSRRTERQPQQSRRPRSGLERPGRYAPATGSSSLAHVLLMAPAQIRPYRLSHSSRAAASESQCPYSSCTWCPHQRLRPESLRRLRAPRPRRGTLKPSLRLSERLRPVEGLDHRTPFVWPRIRFPSLEQRYLRIETPTIHAAVLPMAGGPGRRTRPTVTISGSRAISNTCPFGGRTGWDRTSGALEREGKDPQAPDAGPISTVEPVRARPLSGHRSCRRSAATA